MAERDTDAAADAALAQALEHARAGSRVHDLNALQASVFAIGLARCGEHLVTLAERAFNGGELDMHGEPTMVIAAIGFAMFETGVKLDNEAMRVNARAIVERCFEAFFNATGGR